MDAALVDELRRMPPQDRYGAQELMEGEACRRQDEMADSELLHRAMAFLEECAAVGFSDRIDDFAALVAYQLRWAPPQSLAMRNSAPHDEPRYQLSDVERDAILERDLVDVRLVDAARRQFAELWNNEDSCSTQSTWIANLASAGKRIRGELFVDLLDPIPGRGWLPVMEGSMGRVRWMGPRLEATIDLPVKLRRGTRVEVCCASALDPALFDAWSLEVNTEPVALERRSTPEGIVCSGVVATRKTEHDRVTQLVFRVPHTVRYPLEGPMTDDARSISELRSAGSDSILLDPRTGVTQRAITPPDDARSLLWLTAPRGRRRRCGRC